MAIKKSDSKVKSSEKTRTKSGGTQGVSAVLSASQKISQTDSSKAQFISQHKKQLIVGVLLVGLIAFLYFYKSLFVVALVNGSPITRIALVKELEKQGGKKTLDGMVTNILILQESKKRNVSISQDDLNKELKKIEAQVASQGQNLDTLLAMQGFSRADLLERVKTQKLVEKMVAKDVSISDKDIKDYVEKNKAAFPPEANEKDMEDQARKALKQQKLDEKIQTFVSDLQKKAKINYFLNL